MRNFLTNLKPIFVSVKMSKKIVIYGNFYKFLQLSLINKFKIINLYYKVNFSLKITHTKSVFLLFI